MDSVIKDRINKIEEGIVPQGYKETKIGIIPEDWEVEKLEQISDKVNVGFVGTCEKYYVNKNEGIPMLRTGNIKDQKLDLLDLKYVSKEFHEKNIKSHVKKNDLLLARHGSNGQTALYESEITSNCLNIIIITPNNVKVNSIYLYYQINSQNVNRMIMSRVGGSTQKVVNLGDIKPLSIPTPPLEEQEEIADILSTWDKAIENIEKLIKEKEIQKKGLMQELLTGETRLPGFSGEWGEITLGEVGRFFNGRNLAKKDIEDKGSYNCILYGELFTLYSEIICNIENKTNNMEENSVIGMSNDLLFPTSTTVDALSLITPSSLKVDNVILGGDIMVYRADKNIIDSSYLSYYFNSSGKMQLARFAQGITIIHIYSSDVKDLKINLPPLPEQKAIAEILSTADKEIQLLNKLLEYKKEEKKGLMQLLLTGIVRV